MTSFIEASPIRTIVIILLLASLFVLLVVGVIAQVAVTWRRKDKRGFDVIEKSEPK